MENNGAKITISESKDIHVIIKKGTSTETLYHNIINLMATSRGLHGTDPQKILGWMKQKNFFHEHEYKPVV